ncbi:MAG TPA: glycosyltransferase family 4 protein [Steroidobacteraceae bacterium]|jgi:glycosyltransferase involved in cell wall biosynthesis
MKILFVTNQVPFPPDNGVRIVSHHAMRLMSEAGHELALAVLTEETDDPAKRFARAAAYCQKDRAWWMPLPRRSRIDVQLSAALREKLYFVERYRCTAFRLKLTGLIEIFRPDAIHFDIITLLQYVAIAPAGVGTVASINDSNGLTLENALVQGKYAGLTRVYRKMQLRHTRRYEATEYPRFDAVHLMSEIDAAYLTRLNPSINTVVISNGVDPLIFKIADQTRNKIDLIFVGKLVADNLQGLRTFLEVSWPLIESQYRDLKLHIIGEVGAEAQRLKANFGDRNNIVFHGYIENLTDVYRNCGIAIVPINKDCGLINKVIEAMAAGLAVVGFGKTFASIREAKDGQDFVSAADFAHFGQVVADLIRDDSRRISIQNAAHVLAKQYYKWSTRAARYESMYRLSAERAMSKLTVPAAD